MAAMKAISAMTMATSSRLATSVAMATTPMIPTRIDEKSSRATTRSGRLGPRNRRTKVRHSASAISTRLSRIKGDIGVLLHDSARASMEQLQGAALHLCQVAAQRRLVVQEHGMDIEHPAIVGDIQAQGARSQRDQVGNEGDLELAARL